MKTAKKNLLRAVFFTLFCLLAAYLYFDFGPVYTGAPTSGSDELMFLKSEFERKTEMSDFKNGIIEVSEYAILGYRDVPADVMIFTLRYSVEYVPTLGGLEDKTASVVPVVIRNSGGEILWDEFSDADYEKQFRKLPGTIREILLNTEKHNAIVQELDAKAETAAWKIWNG